MNVLTSLLISQLTYIMGVNFIGGGIV